MAPAMVVFLVITILLGCETANAAEHAFTVNGEPPLGAFGVDTLDHVLACKKMGMNLVFSYHGVFGKKQLDLNDPMGKAIAEHRMKVLFNASWRYTRVRLATDLKSKDTTIRVVTEEPVYLKAFPSAGTLTIEGERITYSGRTTDAFTGCQRGRENTKAARHRAGLLLCNSEALRQEILAVKDSPSLWGYWLVDDARPNEGDSLQEMARVIRQADRRADGTPYGHIILFGVGGMTAMPNFSAGISDGLGVYLYPYHRGKLNRSVRRKMLYIMSRTHALQPDIKMIGLLQCFRCEGTAWTEMPTPEQIREDAISYLEYGAEGLMAFCYYFQPPGKKPRSLEGHPSAREAITQIFADVRAGRLKPAKPVLRTNEWFRLLTGTAANPSDGVAAIALSKPEHVDAFVKSQPPGRVTPNPQSSNNDLYPVRMLVPPYRKDDPKSDRYPSVYFTANMLATTDWRDFLYLEQPVYNPMDHSVTLGATIWDMDGPGWSQSNLPIPAQTRVLLRIPMEEAAMVMDLRKIQYWQLHFADPMEEIVLHIGSPVLVPRKR